MSARLLQEADPCEWSAEDVASRVSELSLSKDYASTIVSNNLSGKQCLVLARYAAKGDAVGATFVTTQLKDMGFDAVGDRMEMLDWICRCSSSNTQPSLVQRSVVQNPLLSKPREEDNGFRKARIEQADADDTLPLFSFQNPAMGPNGDSSTTDARRKSRRSLVAPEWSATPELEDEVPENFWQAVYTTVVSWKKHLQLMGIIIIYALYYETLSWLGNGDPIVGIVCGVAKNFMMCFYSVVQFVTLYLLTEKGDPRDRPPDPLLKKLTAIFAGLTLIMWMLILSSSLAPSCQHTIYTNTTVTNATTNMTSFELAETSRRTTGCDALFDIGIWMWCIGLFLVQPIIAVYLFRKMFRWERAWFIIALLLGVITFQNVTVSVAFSELAQHRVEEIRSTIPHLLVGMLVLLVLRTAAFDSLWSFQNDTPIRGNAGYLAYLLFYILFFAFWCATMLQSFKEIFGDSEAGLFALLIVWSLFLTVVYLNAKLVARRCTPFEKIPLVILPLQLVGDLFTEMVFINFKLTDWSFWVVMVFDVFLLVMRDADLWDDFAILVRKRAGRIGSLVLYFGELLAGPDMANMSLGATDKHQKVQKGSKSADKLAFWDTIPTPEQQSRVKRELTENCIVSEMLASMILLVTVTMDIILDLCNAPGFSSITKNLSNTQRLQSMTIYLVIMICQILGIFISHQIIRYKNEMQLHLQALKAAVTKTNTFIPPKPAHCDWHFFLSHCQSTAGDQVYSLCLELESLGYQVWYDQRANDLTSEGMKDGVRKSGVFVLFLSQGVMSRPFVHLEVREALRLRKKVLLVHETDARFHAVEFAEEREAAPIDLKHLFDDHESIAWRRRKFEREAVLRELFRRVGPAYEERFAHHCEDQRAQTNGKRDRKCSVISPHSVWFDRFFWYRVLLGLYTVNGCMSAVKQVACLGYEPYTPEFEDAGCATW